jgi:hypothetical protein
MIRTAMLLLALGAAAAPAQATRWFASLDAEQEVHSVTSPARGYGELMLSGSILSGFVNFSNLTSPMFMAHIHCCSPRDVNSGIALDFGTVPTTLSGRIEFSFDLSRASSFTSAFLSASGGTAAGAQARLLGAFDNETAYFNLHTLNFRPGEIRGQIAAVPEPASWALLIAGFGLTGAAVRRRHQQAQPAA